MTKINEKVALQFIKGENELDQPEIRLFRNLDGKQGRAVYKFYKPKTITINNFKSIQRMYLIDSEGVLSTRKIDISISENHVKEVHSTYNWKSADEFERFIRFATRYANSLTNN